MARYRAKYHGKTPVRRRTSGHEMMLATHAFDFRRKKNSERQKSQNSLGLVSIALFCCSDEEVFLILREIGDMVDRPIFGSSGLMWSCPYSRSTNQLSNHHCLASNRGIGNNAGSLYIILALNISCNVPCLK